MDTNILLQNLNNVATDFKEIHTLEIWILWTVTSATLVLPVMKQLARIMGFILFLFQYSTYYSLKESWNLNSSEECYLLGCYTMWLL
jgi:hypothetical protein